MVGDVALVHGNLEGAIVSPGAVPGVDTKPVVLTVFSAPSDGLDGMATELSTGLVSVDTALVGEEVFVDSEGGGDGSVG